MIDLNITFDLPLPWTSGTYTLNHVGPVSYLVGPNGSGKTRFAKALFEVLPGKKRFVGTDRLALLDTNPAIAAHFGDSFREGYSKNHFRSFREAAKHGSGLDAFVLLEERFDLRIQVEATISHLFSRRISLEWNAGYLVPTAYPETSLQSYRVDREECHGIRELIILLTYLYDNQVQHLIIDEPELNLHPQYQAFLMQEIRKVCGSPTSKKKLIYLVTHSPYILDIRTAEDLCSLFSFDLSESPPTRVSSVEEASGFTSLLPRLNVHHKQIFFSDNPVLVEGTLDAQLISAIQQSRGVSIAASGSCVVDVGGSDEVNKYLKLCQVFSKKAFFLYDLDSLFTGNLRSCIKADSSIKSFLLTAGLGSDFGNYCGQLDRALTEVIDQVLASSHDGSFITSLINYLSSFGERTKWKSDAFSRARVATLTAISKDRIAMVEVTSENAISDIEARLQQIVTALQEKGIYLLSGGTIERYIPSYSGNPFSLQDSAKSSAIALEVQYLAMPRAESVLSDRYGALFSAVACLPGKASVDIERTLREYVSRYIHDLQAIVTSHPDWAKDQVENRLRQSHPNFSNVVSLSSLERSSTSAFIAIVHISELLDSGPQYIEVTQNTNAGVGDFTLRALP